MTLKEIVKDKKVRFKFYKDGELWYETDDGFDFPSPLLIREPAFLRPKITPFDT